MHVIPLEVGAVDLEAGLVWRDGRRHLLSGLQRGLLHALTDTPGPVTTETLLREVWGYHPRVRSRAVASAVVGVRRIVERDPGKPRHLLTVRGVGYQFAPASSAPAWVALSNSAAHPGLPRELRDQLALHAAEALSLQAPAEAVARLEGLRDRPTVRERAVTLLIGIRPWLGDLEGALAEAEGSPTDSPGCAHSKALLALRLGHPVDARARFVGLADAAPSARVYALSQLHGAVSDLESNDAARRLDEAVAGAREAGDDRVTSWCLGFRGEVRADRGDLDGASADAEVSERLARQSLAEHELAAARALQLRVARLRGDRALAAAVWSELEGLRQRPGFATAHPGFVRGLELEGQRQVAQRRLREGRALAKMTGDTWALGRLEALRTDLR